MDIREYEVAKVLIEEIETNQFEDRRRAEYKAYKVAEGGQRSYILDELQELFPKSWETMRVSDISVSNKVLSKVAKAYKESPIRVLEGQEDELKDILAVGDFDSRMAEFDRDYNRQRYALLWVNETDGVNSFHSLKGFESFVKRSPTTGKIKAVVINYPDKNITYSPNGSSDGIEQKLSESQDDSSANSKVYAMWTEEFHAVWESKETEDSKGTLSSSIERVSIEGNDAGLNSLGVLPFVYISRNSSPDLPFLNQLTEQSITYNILNTDLLTASALQGYGQLVINMPEDQAVETMHSGMTTAITLPIINGVEAQADAKYINPNPDLGGMKDTVDNYASDILSEHGIQAATVNDGNSGFSSGLERLIAQADVTDQISSNQMIYAGVEKEVVKILEAYGALRESSEDLAVIFPKPKALISDKELIDTIEKRMNLGLITKVEALQMLDPNLDDDQAQDKLDKIEEEKLANLEMFTEAPDANIEREDKLRTGPNGKAQENFQK